MKRKLRYLVNEITPVFGHFVAGLLIAVVFFSVLLNQTAVTDALLRVIAQPAETEPTPVVNQEIIGPTMAAAEPVRLRIPDLAIDAGFTAPLGLLDSGEVAVPDSNTEVGWYQYSPTPGALGPSVILGHVDSYTGPAVFFYLGQLEPGDDIYIDRADGTVAHFQVDALERPKQSEFPTNQVYGNINHAGLRLITCSGIYLRGQAQYSHNLIVYASLVATE